jgi:hypothetical protein
MTSSFLPTLYQIPFFPYTRKARQIRRNTWSFHLADCFYPIPALHFAETFAALPA